MISQPGNIWEADTLAEIEGLSASQGVQVGQTCFVKTGIPGIYECTVAGVGSSTWVLLSGGGGGGSSLSKIDTGVSGFTDIQFHVTCEVGEDLDDQSGNGYDWRSTQTETYVEVEGLRALYCRSATRLDENAGPGNSPNLQIIGNLTVYILVYDNDGRMDSQPIYPAFLGVGETEATNHLYSIRKDSTGEDEIFWERSGGIDELEELEYGTPVGRWTVKTLRVAADGVTCDVFHNGVVHTSFVMGNAATGGTSAELVLEDYFGYLGEVIVCSAAHSDATILAAAASTGIT